MNNILITNHKAKQCGVYQYGLRTANILSKSSNYNFIHCEVSNEQEYLQCIEKYNPKGVIYNFYGGTSPWINANLLSKFPNITHYSFHHEGPEPNHLNLDYHIMIDATYQDNDKCFSLPRPLFEGIKFLHQKTTIPIINSFGFPSKHKGFHKIVKLVNEQYDEAIINLHMPMAFFRDYTKNILDEIVPECRSYCTKQGITLNITHDFLSDYQILEFLTSSSINIFLYDDMVGCGLSSVIDFALSVDTPIAIRKSDMFRHISKTIPSICVEDRSLADIINAGTEPLQQYKNKWSNTNLINKCEAILDKTFKKKL